MRIAEFDGMMKARLKKDVGDGDGVQRAKHSPPPEPQIQGIPIVSQCRSFTGSLWFFLFCSHQLYECIILEKLHILYRTPPPYMAASQVRGRFMLVAYRTLISKQSRT